MLKDGPPLPGGGSGIPVKPNWAMVCVASVALLLEEFVLLKPARTSFTRRGVITQLCEIVRPASTSGAIVGPALMLPLGAFCTERFLYVYRAKTVCRLLITSSIRISP